MKKSCPYPASSSIFCKLNNQARSPQKTTNFPNLVVENTVYKSDDETANLFKNILAETFTESGLSTDFDSVIYNYVNDFVKKLNYSDNNFNRVSFHELVKVIKTLGERSSPGEDGVHNIFLKRLTLKGIYLILKLINLSLETGLPEG